VAALVVEQCFETVARLSEGSAFIVLASLCVVESS